MVHAVDVARLPVQGELGISSGCRVLLNIGATQAPTARRLDDHVLVRGVLFFLRVTMSEASEKLLVADLVHSLLVVDRLEVRSRLVDLDLTEYLRAKLSIDAMASA